MDWYIFDWHTFEYHYIQNLIHTLVYIQEDFRDKTEDKSKRLGHLFLYTDYLVHMVMEYMGYWALIE